MIYTLPSCALNCLALIAMDGMYAGFAGAKACLEKITALRSTFNIYIWSSGELVCIYAHALHAKLPGTYCHGWHVCRLCIVTWM